jgi:murein DD-endopeptidase MepM/ murein hydrolase activator NlpD
MLAAVVLAIVGLGIAPADEAFAADYPSWQDVQNARNSVTATAAEVDRITAVLAELEAAVVAAEAFAEQKGYEFEDAQAKSDAAQFKWLELQGQADAAQKDATASQRRAGQQAALLSRYTGRDLSASLFFDSTKSADVLSQLGLATVVKGRSAEIYKVAIQQQNTAAALTAQADVAKAALKERTDAAAKAMQEAADASAQAEAAAAEQAANKERLEAQKAALVENQAVTEAGYNAGVAERARIAAEYAAAHPSAASSAGVVSAAGWARPAGGHITSSFSIRRFNPASHVWAAHLGTDLGAACNSPIYAAHEGTVTFTGKSGGYGNLVRLDNGGGVTTAYGHIVNGGILVSAGQHVKAGQQIARVGSTGNSTGCHLHFETRPGGTAVDAVPFMRERGVELNN